MSTNKLPSIITPVPLCNQLPEGTTLTGEVALQDLLNLTPELRKQGLTPISYHLHFYRDEEDRLAIKGEMVGDFEQICQRCMQPMRCTIKAEILVSPVNSDSEAKRLPEQYEPLLMAEGTLNLLEWIAEEMHLALPLVPRHEVLCISHESYINNKMGE
jgi:uncharacterized protein